MPVGVHTLPLLNAPAGSPVSVHVQIVRFDGTNYTRLSSANLPAVTAPATRANVWLFQQEPFVNPSPGFVASLRVTDWTDRILGLPGSLEVFSESDSGPANGLGNESAQQVTLPAGGAQYAVPNQYHDSISTFSFAGPRPPAPVSVQIAPPPGVYSGSVSVTFTPGNSSDQVFHRFGVADAWHGYASLPLVVTNDTTIWYCGTNAITANRSLLFSASYVLGHAATEPPLPVNLNPGNTNQPPTTPTPTNTWAVSPKGTLFFGRRSVTNTGTIWAIDIDDAHETYITAGVHLRASRDGRYLAFLREGDPLGSRGNVWWRDMESGVEARLFQNNDYVVSYDWLPDDSGLVADYLCSLMTLNTNGASTAFAYQSCWDDWPVVNHVDQRIAYHSWSLATAD